MRSYSSDEYKVFKIAGRSMKQRRIHCIEQFVYTYAYNTEPNTYLFRGKVLIFLRIFFKF